MDKLERLTIMAINPSCNNVVGKALPVLGDPPFDSEAAEQAISELQHIIPDADLTFSLKSVKKNIYKTGSEGDRLGRMGIQCFYDGQEKDIEQVSLMNVEANAYGWSFRRAWYYWICCTETNPIPKQIAEKLNAELGQQVRVNGFAGGHDVEGDISSYHVDTFVGLHALLKVIRDLNNSE